jgi:hypothetical protein
MNEQTNWEQIEERSKRKEQQIQRLHYSKERQVIKMSIYNQANEWARLMLEFFPNLVDSPNNFKRIAKELIEEWEKILYEKYKFFDIEFDNLYFQNIQEKKKSRN